jgi:hypothetical protein
MQLRMDAENGTALAAEDADRAARGRRRWKEQSLPQMNADPTTAWATLSHRPLRGFS